ncbi:hypothetical protein QWY93_01920 [Echinicola jeungdonensis]|uniref:Uncharacterized protein n=1 Tax=Echinicola jeungdonensis TaxID=709343 RepID=A0ABV5J5Z0_9BACT|nr:hypothetical protein [Echinicola jeungdonensis]MDN3668091.1 hypothetical protein [Echinicola jeungdonensis]
MKKQKTPSSTKSKIQPSEEEKLWAKVYRDTEEWLSQIEFIADELKFFHLLLDKYFIWLNSEKFQGKTKYFLDWLVSLEKKQKSLANELKNQLKEISFHLKSKKELPPQEIRENDLELEVLQEDLVKDFRYLKKEIFQLTEASKDLMRGGHLLGKQKP